MTESMIVEAIRAAGGASAAAAVPPVSAPLTVANPAAVSRFQAAMAADPVPFASETAAAWRSAQVNNQGILHRIRALSDNAHTRHVTSGELVELQYELMNLSFQQTVVTKVADKSSTAIQTLVKNQ